MKLRVSSSFFVESRFAFEVLGKKNFQPSNIGFQFFSFSFFKIPFSTVRYI